MKIDLYSKFILTIIAVSLIWIGTQNSMRDAIAQSSIVSIANQPIKVVICNEKTPVASMSPTAVNWKLTRINA